jgi:hypothetical protein
MAAASVIEELIIILTPDRRPAVKVAVFKFVWPRDTQVVVDVFTQSSSPVVALVIAPKVMLITRPLLGPAVVKYGG